MAKRTKEHIRKLKSPIRWAVLALIVAIILFCIEISLSCYSLYLSLAGGITVCINWLDTFFLVFAIFFAVAAVAMIPLAVFALSMWLKEQEKEDSSMKQDIFGMKQDITKIKTKLGIEVNDNESE